MLEWQGMALAAVSLVVTALLARWLRRKLDRRNARKREALLPAASRQVRRARARKAR